MESSVFEEKQSHNITDPPPYLQMKINFFF